MSKKKCHCGPDEPCQHGKTITKLPPEQALPPMTQAIAAHERERCLRIAEHYMKPERPQFYACTCCGAWHRAEYDGDCRDNDERFTAGQLDVLFPDNDGDGCPDWVEVEVQVVE